MESLGSGALGCLLGFSDCFAVPRPPRGFKVKKKIKSGFLQRQYKNAMMNLFCRTESFQTQVGLQVFKMCKGR